MKKKKGKKSNAQLIIGALLSGKSLRSRDISDMVSEMAGKDIKVQDVASMLSKISNTKKSDLGFFIKRVKEGNSFTYNMVNEALKLSEGQAYDLTLKIGKDRYTLEQALKDFPGLRKYVGAAAKTKAKPGPKPKVNVKAKAKKEVARKATAKPVAKVVPSADIGLSDKLSKMIMQKIGEELGNLNLSVKVSLNIEGTED